MSKIVEAEIFEACPFASILPSRTPRLPRLVIPSHEDEDRPVFCRGPLSGA